MRDEKLRKINSATKYPSIPTYHEIDAATGMLQPKLTLDWEGAVFATEKVDGTNARIIVLPETGKWLIGSRETLLTSEGDMVANYDLGIVEGLLPIVEQVRSAIWRKDLVATAYLEVFGQRGTSQWKQYGDGKATGARLIDVSLVGATALDMTREQVASWRDRGNQVFVDLDELLDLADQMDVPTVPGLFEVDASLLPQTIEETAEFLTNLIPTTHVRLTPDGVGAAEGLVLRSADRKLIAKLRHQDYQGTLRRQAYAARLAEKEARRG